ncbi:replication protein A 70 kDa DNA-binding subunit D-like [Salvia miltiorrhiza]|uniref:replication protein A 70 kDa DNA-binding subunit D-like n=1 Tax=Salvia miltiorrhiza TaxID=226208 RepID=UPI0025AB6237|nr:replication protein A 70 kDa DNA-binding subunit D-like [Salvia miltiorrhiza]
MVPMKTTSGAHSKTVRDITIVNKENQFMEISLWEDMAINEGDKLQKVLEQNPIIVITNVAAKKFLGALQLQSTVRSVLQTSPECPEIKHMEQRSYETYDPLRITTSKMIQKMTNAKEVMLKDLKENQHMLVKVLHNKLNMHSLFSFAE